MVFKRLTKRRRRKQARMGDPDAVPWRRTQARAEQTKESMSAINQVWASEQESMRICVWAKTQMQMHKSTDQHSRHARTHARHLYSVSQTWSWISGNLLKTLTPFGRD